MEEEKIQKKVEKLDSERKRDQAMIATLEKRLENIEASYAMQREEINELSSELIRTKAMMARMDSIDTAIADVRVEFGRSLESIEKIRQEHEREQEKVRRQDQEVINRALADLKKELDVFPEIRSSIQARVEEDIRLSRTLEELEKNLDQNIQADEESRRSQRLLTESQRQDTKRLADVQAEVAAMRKRQDEIRGKLDVATGDLRKMELRLNEYQAAEMERRQAQVSFIEKQTLLSIERERTWKEWDARFSEFTNQAVNLDAQMQELDSTHRTVKRSLESFEEVKQRFERRVNEITEMQRLLEERFRQEWVAFKADDQKRWTNYTLTQDEQMREAERKFEKQNERLVHLEDLTHEISDLMDQMMDDTKKRLQVFLSSLHQWAEEYDKTFNRNA